MKMLVDREEITAVLDAVCQAHIMSYEDMVYQARGLLVDILNKADEDRKWADKEIEKHIETTNREAVVELLEILCQNEKRKNVGLGANITTLLQGELDELRTKLEGEK
jgi:hypothetical protein